MNRTPIAEDRKRKAKDAAERRRAMLCAAIPDAAARLWLYLQDRQGANQSAFPSQATIANDLHWSRNKVQQWLRYSEHNGLIRAVSRSRGHATRYYVRRPGECLGEDGRPRPSGTPAAGKVALPAGLLSEASSPASGATSADQPRRRGTVAPSTGHPLPRPQGTGSPAGGAQNKVSNKVIEQGQERRGSCAIGQKANGNGKSGSILNLPTAELPADLRGLAVRLMCSIADSLHLAGEAYQRVQVQVDTLVAKALLQAGSRAEAVARAMEQAAAIVGADCQARRVAEPEAIVRVWQDRMTGQAAGTIKS